MEETNPSPSKRKLLIMEEELEPTNISATTEDDRQGSSGLTNEAMRKTTAEVIAGSWCTIETEQVEFYDFLGLPLNPPPQREDPVPEENPELKRRRIEREVDLTLRLYENPWKILKTLTKSDVNGHLCRLIVPKKDAEEHILGVWGEDDTRVTQVKSERGARVRVWDYNTASEHELLFKLWTSSQSYVFTETWKQNFVKRRGLKEGDEVGLYWDSATSRFCFIVFAPRYA